MKISQSKLCLLFLFLFSINFFNYESRIIVILFAFAICIIHEWKLPITPISMLLGIYSIIYYGFAALYNPSMMSFYVIPFLLAPFMGYSIGIVLMRTLPMDKEVALKAIIYIITAGRFVHGLLNFVASNGYSGYIRNGVDFWTHSTLAATGQGALMTMSISLCFYGIFILRKNRVFEKIVVLVMVFLSLLNNLMSASRTAIIIMIIVFLTSFVVYVFSPKENRSNKKKIVFRLLLLILALYVLFRLDIFGMRTYWEISPLYERLHSEVQYISGDENRLSMIINTLNSVWDNPLGDGDMATNAHNLWLDALKQTGWIPFIMLVIFTALVINKVMLLLRCGVVCLEIKYLVLSIVLGVLINFAVEPIMNGIPYYFVSFCIIAGSIEEFDSRLVCQKSPGHVERE